jgi:DNA mismatch repair ATPase MutS
MLDVLAGFAELKLTSHRPWCCPQVRESGPFVVKQGRHPILAELHNDHAKVTVEAATTGGGAAGGGAHAKSVATADRGGEVVPNDTFMDKFSSLHVVSGVNGSGKTT